MENLPSPNQVSDSFYQSGLSGGSKQQLLLTNIGKTAMRNLRAKQMIINYPKTWIRYSPGEFQRLQKFNRPIPYGERNLKRMKMLESFVQYR